MVSKRLGIAVGLRGKRGFPTTKLPKAKAQKPTVRIFFNHHKMIFAN